MIPHQPAFARTVRLIATIGFLAAASAAFAQLTITNIPSYNLFTRVSGADVDAVPFNIQTDDFFLAPANNTRNSSFSGDNPLGDVAMSATAIYSATILGSSSDSSGFTEYAAASYSVSPGPGGETSGLLAQASADAGIWAIRVTTPTQISLSGSLSLSSVFNDNSGITFSSVGTSSPFTITTLAQITTNGSFYHTFLLQPDLEYHITGNAELTRNFSEPLTGITEYNFRIAVLAIPEPSTYAAIFGGAALVGVLFLRRRRNA